MAAMSIGITEIPAIAAVTVLPLVAVRKGWGRRGEGGAGGERVGMS